MLSSDKNFENYENGKKNKSRDIKAFDEVVIPARWGLFFIGLAILEYPVDNFWPKLSIAYALLIHTIYTLTLINIWPVMIESLQLKAIKFNTGVYFFLFYTMIIELYLTLIVAWIRNKKFSSLIKLINKAEEQLFMLGINIEYKCLIRTVYFIRIFQVLTIVTFIITVFHGSFMLKQHSVFEKIAMCIVIVFPTIVSTLSFSCFTILISLYGKRFGQLRRFLKNLITNPDKPQHANVCEYTNFDNTNDSINFLIDEKFNDNYQLINNIRFAHIELVKVAKITDSVYGLSMAITLIITSATCTGVLYIIWVTVCIKNNGTMMEKLEQIEILLGWLFFSILKFVIISFACGRTSNLANNIGNIVCLLHEPSASKKFCSELTNFVFQLMDTKLVFKPCGLIELNNSTLCYIVSSIMSLLIVLIQMRDIPSSVEELIELNNTKT